MANDRYYDATVPLFGDDSTQVRFSEERTYARQSPDVVLRPWEDALFMSPFGSAIPNLESLTLCPFALHQVRTMDIGVGVVTVCAVLVSSWSCHVRCSTVHCTLLCQDTSIDFDVDAAVGCRLRWGYAS